MRRRFPLRIGIVAAVIVGSLLYLYPPPFARSYLYGPAAPGARPGGILPSTLNLGLDLQGGIHLVLGVDLDKAIEAQVERAGSGIRSSLEKKGIAVKGIQRRGPTELVVELASPEAWAVLSSRRRYTPLGSR